MDHAAQSAAPDGKPPRPLRRVGVVGDVHGEAENLALALAYLADVPALDALLCTGDLPGKRGFGDTDRSCRLLADASVRTVRGNHDRYYTENAGVRAMLEMPDAIGPEARTFLYDLPPMRRFDTVRGPLLLCHGLGDDDLTGIEPETDDAMAARLLESYGLDEFAVIVAGHTHRPMARTVGATILVNPGSLVWRDGPGFLVLDLAAGTAEAFDIDPVARIVAPAGVTALP